jgi:hypothetical protein
VAVPTARGQQSQDEKDAAKSLVALDRVRCAVSHVSYNDIRSRSHVSYNDIHESCLLS